MPLEDKGGAGGVVDFDVVVQVAILILLGVGEVLATHGIAALTAKFRVVSCQLNSILARARNLCNIVWNRGLVVPVEDKEQVRVNSLFLVK